MPRSTEVTVFAGEVVDQTRDFTPALESGQTVTSATITFDDPVAALTASTPTVSTPVVSWRTTTTTGLAPGAYHALLLAVTNTGEVIGHSVRYLVQ